MNNYNILNRFFSKNTLLDIIENKNNSCYGEIIRRYSLDKNKTNRNVVSSIYTILSKEYRNEYFYKNTLLNKLIIKKHKIYTTKVITELPIGKSIADFVTLNGKAVAYEIKTELDNLERIETQVEDYYKCFPYVCIVTCQEHVQKIVQMFQNTTVGIYCFSNKNSIKFIQEPQPNFSKLDYEVMFKVLRKYEFEHIIKYFYKTLPNTNQFEYYSECFKMFEQLDKNLIYKKMLSVLKERCFVEVEKFEQIPLELKMLVYQSKFNQQQYDRLNDFLNSNYKIGGQEEYVFSIFER